MSVELKPRLHRRWDYSLPHPQDRSWSRLCAVKGCAGRIDTAGGSRSLKLCQRHFQIRATREAAIANRETERGNAK